MANQSTHHVDHIDDIIFLQNKTLDSCPISHSTSNSRYSINKYMTTIIDQNGSHNEEIKQHIPS